jgi:NAD(P)-dependent dehydrogenase (short-subunit alcohol dehydrogenase family)
MLRLFSLEGRRALITGGGSSLGRQIALAYAESGADLVLCGRRQRPLEETAEMAQAYGAGSTAIAADITVEADVQRLAAEAGQVDILVNNAGWSPFQPWQEVSLEDWRGVMAVNLDAPFRLCQVFAPPMMERGWGRIINIASIYGLIGANHRLYKGIEWDVPSYFASKHGINGITHHLAPRLAPYGVCINSLTPGGFKGSEQNDAAGMNSPELIEAINGWIPMGRLGGPEDLKAAAVFLASPGAQYVTGSNLVVDGGWSAW